MHTHPHFLLFYHVQLYKCICITICITHFERYCVIKIGYARCVRLKILSLYYANHYIQCFRDVIFYINVKKIKKLSWHKMFIWMNWTFTALKCTRIKTNLIINFTTTLKRINHIVNEKNLWDTSVVLKMFQYLTYF